MVKGLIHRQPEAFGKVAVLMGGSSAEREISLESGAAVLAALHRLGIDAHGVDWTGGLVERLRVEGFDRVFIALHGRGGEDGQIQGMLQIMELPYTGSGVLGSALAMDKCRSKWIWLSMGLPTPPFVELSPGFDPEVIVRDQGLPLMVKPAHEGSSIGVSKVSEARNLLDAWSLASKYDGSVVAEKWIDGTEYTVTIVADEPYPLIKLETPRTFYDYEAKYRDDTTRYICPCGLPPEREAALQDLASRAFHAVGASGWGRVDLMMDESGEPWLIEVNTVPGMTSHSLVPMAARSIGVEFDELVLRILGTSLR